MPSIVTLPSASENAVTDQKKFTQSWFMFFQDLWRAVRRNLGVKLGGTVNVNTTSKSNSDTSETDLITYEIAANTLVNNSDYIEIIASGVFASNANAKILKLYFGSQIIYQTDSNTANGGSWQFRATIIRTSSTTQEICTELLASNPAVQNDANYPLVRTAGTQDLTSSLVIKTTGQGSTTNDIIQYVLITKLFPYN